MITRRRFAGGLAVAGGAALVGLPAAPAVGQPPPETTSLRLTRSTSICQAPQYIADALFEAEGFTDVRHIDATSTSDRPLISGEAQLGTLFVGPLLLRLDEGAPLVILAGGHIGCLEVFGHEPIRAVKDLKGKTVTIGAVGGPAHVFAMTIMTYVGLDARKDIKLLVLPPREGVRAFEDRRADAVVTAPPFGQELRARKLGRVVVNSAIDRPWSQYFCCLVVARRDFVHKHPVATKRALRAILKGADLCALEPERAASALQAKGFTESYDYALQTMRELPYGKWREYDPEDTVRFYALRLHEVGMIRSSPQKLIAQGTDWRFLNELRKELKG
jgi:NitT/TauT family transport system substrate-binding protein